MATNKFPPVIEYYSGSQVTVFIEDVWVDDAASYQINISQAKQPIYGYGSQYYDFVAQGKVLVQGQLTINYKDPNYLWIILANKSAQKRRAALEIKEQRRRQINSTTFDASNSEGLVRRLQNNSSSDRDFKEISELFEETYWNRPARNPIIDDEPEGFNHDPFTMHFLYKGDSAGVIEELTDVSLLGKSKIVEANGQPIQEVYNFIARKYR